MRRASPRNQFMTSTQVTADRHIVGHPRSTGVGSPAYASSVPPGATRGGGVERTDTIDQRKKEAVTNRLVRRLQSLGYAVDLKKLEPAA